MAQEGPQAPATAPQDVNPYARVEAMHADLRTAIPRARAAIFWENSYPRFVPAFGLTAVFMSSAWSGAWGLLNPDLKMAGLGLFAVAFLACLYPLRKLRIPTAAEGIARIEGNTGLPHEPVQTVMGRSGTTNEISQDLWREHQIAAAAQVDKIRVGAPQINMPQKDPYALRFLPMIFAVMAFASGGIEGYKNLSQPFDFSVPVVPPPPVVPARVDAWVAPPEYTRQAPTFLTVDSAVRAETPSGSELEMPLGSRMTIRISGGEGTVTVTGGAVIETQPEPLAATAGNAEGAAIPAPERAGPLEYVVLLNDDAGVHIEAHGGVSLSWSFDVLGDAAPRVSADATPNEARPGALDIQYEVQDDYGAVSLEGEIERAEPPKTISRRDPRPLVEPPAIGLPVPRNN